jgi:hypothetical protein
MIVAINQPCYLPWRGFFALMKAADVFVFYDDVQFTSNTSRSFFARVQLKTAGGRRWLTVPVRKSGRFGQRIDETEILDDGWPARHCAAIRAAFQHAPFAARLEPLLATLAGRAWDQLADLTVTTTLQMAELFGLARRTLRASAMDIGGSGSGARARRVPRAGRHRLRHRPRGARLPRARGVRRGRDRRASTWTTTSRRTRSARAPSSPTSRRSTSWPTRARRRWPT